MKLPQDVQDIIVNMVLGMRHREKFIHTLKRIKLIDRTVVHSSCGKTGLVFISAWKPVIWYNNPRSSDVGIGHTYWAWRYTWFELDGKKVISGKAGIFGSTSWKDTISYW